ncbi:MAG TPA: IPT/TIG domain-containing protein [Gemmatimonadaceae bacterium]|nr:IPT/TIG domain-containing protein [Gemmatimonadaceae bacterium]
MRKILAFLALLALPACGGDGATAPKAEAPTLATVTPATGTVGTELTLTGTNFRSGAQVFVGATLADSIDVSSSTTLYARVPAGVTAGTSYTVRVRNSDGTEFQIPSAFTPVAPTLSFVNGATLPSGNVGSTIILEGSAFGDEQGPGHVLFSDGAGGTVEAVIADPVNDWTNSFIVTTVPNGAVTGDVVVVTGTGTSNARTFTVASAATFSPSTINWTSSTALPAAVSGHKATFAIVGGTNLVYLTGGAGNDSLPVTSVHSASIQPTGGVGAWTATEPLPEGRAFHAAVAATAHNSRVLSDSQSIYVIGGSTDKLGTPTTTVYRGRLNVDGSVRDWVAATSLPVALHSLGVVIFRGEMYIAGGATTGNAPTTHVYRTRIDSTGMLGAWQSLPSLPTALSHHGFAVFGRFLYVVGGATATANPNDGSLTGSRSDQVLYVPINLRTGAFAQASWTVNGSTLTKSASKHGLASAGGTLFMNAGLYSAANTGSSENSYATINADGSVTAFSGATGSNTSRSSGGGNLYNHVTLSYVDANGVSRVLVLGGDDVNAPGSKRSGVFYY